MNFAKTLLIFIKAWGLLINWHSIFLVSFQNVESASTIVKRADRNNFEVRVNNHFTKLCGFMSTPNEYTFENLKLPTTSGKTLEECINENYQKDGFIILKAVNDKNPLDLSFEHLIEVEIKKMVTMKTNEIDLNWFDRLYFHSRNQTGKRPEVLDIQLSNSVRNLFIKMKLAKVVYLKNFPPHHSNQATFINRQTNYFKYYMENKDFIESPFKFDAEDNNEYLSLLRKTILGLSQDHARDISDVPFNNFFLNLHGNYKFTLDELLAESLKVIQKFSDLLNLIPREKQWTKY